MKKIIKVILSSVLILSIIMSLVPAFVVGAAGLLTEEQFINRMNYLKNIFRDGQYWNAYNSVGYEGTGTIICPDNACHNRGYCYYCPDLCGAYVENGTEIAWQCMGYSYKMANLFFGYSIFDSKWETNYNIHSELYAGDIVRINNDMHSVFITKVTDSTVYYTDCNRTGPCQVSWSGSYSISDFRNRITYIKHLSGNTLKGTSTVAHTCNKGEFMYYWAAHPHYNCYKCSVCGTVWDDKSETNVVQSCTDCTSSLYSKIENGYYYLKNNSTNQYMCLSYGIDAQAQNVDMLDFNGSDAMLFDFAADANIGGYSLRPLSCASRVLNVYAETVESGKNVCIYDNVDDGTQRWYFEKVSGGYVIRNVKNPNCVLDLQDGWNVYVSAYTGAASQVWSIETTVTYDANGGTDAPSMQKKNYGETLTLSSAVPQKNGYSFCGWSTDKNATVATYNVGGQFVDNANTTLYAVWSTNTYTISYDANGGDEAPTSQTKIHNSDIILSIDIPTRNGYEFIGWSDNSSSSEVIYKPGDMYTANSDLTLYAVWKAEVYSIVYDANGGINAPAATSIRYGESLTISEIVPVKDKYDFAGWTTDLNDVNAPTYYAGDVLPVKENIVLYAKWSEILYRIDGVIRNSGSEEGSTFLKIVDNGTGVVRSIDNVGREMPFVIYDVDLGSSYTLIASKDKYVTETFEVVIDEREESVDITLYLIGDLTKDGKVNALDKVEISKYIKAFADVDKYSDVNGDGKVNALDKVAITKIIKGTFDFS